MGDYPAARASAGGSARDAGARPRIPGSWCTRCTISPTSIAPWAISTARSTASSTRRDRAGTYLLPIQRSFHLTSIAHIQLQQGRIDDALETYREAIELSRRARHADGLVQSLRTLGDVLFGPRAGTTRRCRICRKAAQLFAQLEDPAAEAEMVEPRRGHPRTAARHRPRRETLETVGSPARAAGRLQGRAGRARRPGPGDAAARRPSPDDAIPAFEAALALATTLGDGAAGGRASQHARDSRMGARPVRRGAAPLRSRAAAGARPG